MSRLVVGVFKFTSCSGCLEELAYVFSKYPQLLTNIDIKYFAEIQDLTELTNMDIAIVEGSIVNKTQEELIKKIRQLSKLVMVIGACASFGGIQSLRVGEDLNKVKQAVYPIPEYIDVYNDVKPIEEVIKVDLIVRGCPVNGEYLANILRALLIGSTPILIYENICSECKRKGIPCIMITKKTPCLGPITFAGCGALCPSFGRGCYGCYGLAEKHIDKEKILEFIKRIEELGTSSQDFKALLKAYSFKFYRELFGE